MSDQIKRVVQRRAPIVRAWEAGGTYAFDGNVRNGSFADRPPWVESGRSAEGGTEPN